MAGWIVPLVMACGVCRVVLCVGDVAMVLHSCAVVCGVCRGSWHGCRVPMWCVSRGTVNSSYKLRGGLHVICGLPWVRSNYGIERGYGRWYHPPHALHGGFVPLFARVCEGVGMLGRSRILPA